MPISTASGGGGLDRRPNPGKEAPHDPPPRPAPGTLEITVKVKIKVTKPGHKVKKVKKTLKANVKVC
jgi:hypothetical protein